MNIQTPEKPFFLEDGSLRVHSIFKTIQGEGPYCGQRAIFVRLWGCNLQCPLCDTEYTSHGGLMTPNELLKAIELYTQNQPSLVVITGGEPFRQNLFPAIELLLANGHMVQLETNGTLFQDLPFDQIVTVCSPKTGSINKALLPNITALKYVMQDGDVSDEDGLPFSALEHPCGGLLARPPEDFCGMIFVQPADEGDPEKNRKNLQAAVKSTLTFGYTLQLQIHKLAGVL